MDTPLTDPTPTAPDEPQPIAARPESPLHRHHVLREQRSDREWVGFDEGWGDGYDFMEDATESGWTPLSAWGLDGWDLGDWPYLTMSIRTKPKPAYLTRCEGDLDLREFDTRDELVAAIDRWFGWFWNFHRERRPEGFEVDDTMLPVNPDHRGPFSWKRLEDTKAARAAATEGATDER